MEKHLKIALFGYGKMGKLVEAIAKKENHEIIAVVDTSKPISQDSLSALRTAHVGIDFSHPSVVSSNIRTAIAANLNLVIGTTGWDDSFEEMKTLIEQSAIGCLYSPNFSIGIALFRKIIAFAAALTSQSGTFDVGGIEAHHREKVDSPSGTAKMLAEIMRKHYPEFSQFSSLRCGAIPGSHSLIFDSPAETITITHEARNREGFALGALQAAEWLHGKQGFFDLDAMFDVSVVN
jgi:4-hydroxy-tetrahydrodipicolinate reductase